MLYHYACRALNHPRSLSFLRARGAMAWTSRNTPVDAFVGVSDAEDNPLRFFPFSFQHGETL